MAAQEGIWPPLCTCAASTRDRVYLYARSRASLDADFAHLRYIHMLRMRFCRQSTMVVSLVAPVRAVETAPIYICPASRWQLYI